MRSSRSVLSMLSLAFLTLLAPACLAQLPPLNNTTSTPIPGAGHDYLNGPTETVNPANGSLSIRVPVIIPPSRGITLPFSFAYDSNGVNYLGYSPGQGYGVRYWLTPSLSTNPWTEGGWSDTLPTVSKSLISWTVTLPPPGEADPSVSPLIRQVPCAALIDYLFQDASGNRHNLGLTNYSDPTKTGPCTTYSTYWPKGFNAQIVLQGGEGPISATLTSGWDSGEPPSIVDGDGLSYVFPESAGSGSWIASKVSDRNGNYLTINSTSSTFNYVDTAGRTVLNDSGFAVSPETLTVSGLGAPYTLTWTTLTTPTFSTTITTTYGSCAIPDLPPGSAHGIIRHENLLNS
jgi:hypothetical protein